VWRLDQVGLPLLEAPEMLAELFMSYVNVPFIIDIFLARVDRDYGGIGRPAVAHELYKAISMRNLWSGHQQPEPLVRDPVRRYRTHCPQMEYYCGQRTRNSSFLWGSPRRGLYQPMV
jgi:hypothetical protein